MGKVLEGNVLTCVAALRSLGARRDVRRVSRVRFPNRFNVTLALVRVLTERREVNSVAL